MMLGAYCMPKKIEGTPCEDASLYSSMMLGAYCMPSCEYGVLTGLSFNLTLTSEA